MVYAEVWAMTNKFVPVFRFFIAALTVSLSFIVHAQYVIDDSFEGARPLSYYAEFVNVGDEILSIEEVQNNPPSFQPLAGTSDIGFTTDHFWLKFQLVNAKESAYSLFIETARPITDEVILYLIHPDGSVEIQRNGDHIPFDQKGLAHRKSIFQINLEKGERVQAYIHLINDGESLVLPLNAYSMDAFLSSTYNEQIFNGIFYGVLLLATIIYLFFFFGLRDRTFLYYTLYVVFIGLMQFSIDGFFHQYILPGGGWLNDRIVLLTALIAGFFLGKYGSVFLGVASFAPRINKLFQAVFVLIGLSVLLLITTPSMLAASYPIANILGLSVLLLLIASILTLKRNKQKVDPYFMAGIAFLVMGFVVFILHNFNSIPNSFFSQNGPKFGTGLEVIFLSISMSNRIRDLRLRSEASQLLALQREQDMNEMKSSFISNISHELRTPLNLIMGITSSLHQSEQEEELKEKYALMLGSSKQLLGLIEDILNFTEIEKGEQSIKAENIDLKEALAEMEVFAQMKAEAKGLKLDWKTDSLPDSVFADREKLIQIGLNLLDNAVKFTEKGQVICQISGVQRNKIFQLSMHIEDTGSGISEEKMSTMYESFTKKSFRDKREFAGLGLGLFVAKSFVDLMQGKLELSSRPNGGVSCWVELPLEVVELDNTERANQVLPAEEEGTASGIRLLLIEDNPMNQMLMKMLVKSWTNVEMEFANNGQEGIDRLMKDSFDLVLMDLQMPVMDGFEATAAIRKGLAGAQNSSIPIIAVTADITAKTRNQVLQLGANDYATKPVDEALLREQISALLHRKIKIKLPAASTPNL